MRILHIPYTYFPDPAGGTEIYVQDLAEWQRQAGHESAIAAPGTDAGHYTHAGIPVWRFAVTPNPNLRELYGEGDRSAAEAFGRVLDQFRPEIVHLHSVTCAVSVRLAEMIVDRHIPVILNYHTPTVSCARGTLFKWGAEICDGRLDHHLCTSCTLHANGLTRPLAALIGSLPVAVSQGIGRTGLSGHVWTALRMPELIDVRIRAFHRLVNTVDRVIALCDWTRELLIRNGVSEARIVLCRQGISWKVSDFPTTAPPLSSRLPLRVAFLGRLDKTKGAHVIVEALRNDNDLPVHLDIFGVCQGDSGKRYAAALRALISNDARIRMLPPISSREVIAKLREYEILAVPSQCLETGPLVVLEAFAARTPVIGSNLGGIAELVKDDIDGLLVEPASSPRAWADSFRRVCSDPQMVARLRAGIQPPRHSRQSALEIMPLYEELAGKRRLVLA